MRRVRLVHWRAVEAEPRIAGLRTAGFTVEYAEKTDPGVLREVRKNPPAAVIIDLTRLPSHGREVGFALRQSKATRGIPLVFAGGEPEKVERVRALLPDAVFTEWAKIRGALRSAMANAPEEPVVPVSLSGTPEGKPVWQKLGLKSGMTVALLNAPDAFAESLGAPEDIRWVERGACDMVLWFVESAGALARGIERLAGAGVPLWIIYPKKAAQVRTDLTQYIVRETALAAGIVDYKICSVDATWTGMLFGRKRSR